MIPKNEIHVFMYMCISKCQSCFNWSHQIKIRNGYIYMGSFNLSVMSLFYGLFKSDILLHLAKSINHFLEYLETDSVPDSLRKYSPFSQSLVTLVYDLSTHSMIPDGHWSFSPLQSNSSFCTILTHTERNTRMSLNLWRKVLVSRVFDIYWFHDIDDITKIQTLFEQG